MFLKNIILFNIFLIDNIYWEYRNLYIKLLTLIPFYTYIFFFVVIRILLILFLHKYTHV